LAYKPITDQQWFCRKFCWNLSAGIARTQLCCERRKLLKCGKAVGMELPLSDHMRGLDPSQGRLGRMECLEAKHGARDPLYEAMILFDDVVEVFDLQYLDGVA
jgi:hypothetical protein